MEDDRAILGFFIIIIIFSHYLFFNKLLFLECDASSPSHYSYALDKFNYTIPYNGLIGGVLVLNAKVYERANGFR